MLAKRRHQRLSPLAVPVPNRSAQTVYIETESEAKAFAESIAGAAAIAVDTEGASFHRFVDRVYLLQLSTAQHHAIIDPLRVGPPAVLRSLLDTRACEVIFHDADYDLRLLHQDYGIRVVNIFDTRVAAQLLGIKAFGLAALLESHFGVKLDKKHQRADWSMRPLTRDMLDYAAQDTRHLLALRDAMRARLERLGRWSWAEEEFRRLEGTRWEPDDPATAFLRLKGARDLTRRELAILKPLVAWRDAVARAQDRSTFRVAGTDVLFELARRAPRTADALRDTKGLSRSIIEREGTRILAAINEGLRVPEHDLPRFPRAARWERDPEFDERVTRLKAVRDRIASELELDPGVLCPRDRLESVARKAPSSLDEMATLPDMRRWQVEVLGPEFLRALRRDHPTTVPANTVDDVSPYRDA